MDFFPCTPSFILIQSFRFLDSSLIIIIDSLSVDFLRTLLFGELFLKIKGSFTVLSLRAGGQVHMDF